MESFVSHYPDWDVMEQKEHWDPHTREIVEKRLRFEAHKSLSTEEAETLYQICSLLTNDKREFILNYVIQHFDSLLAADIGEAQRKANVPKQSVLIRQGIRALDLFTTASEGAVFAGLADSVQHMLLDQLMRGQIQLQADGVNIPAQDFFNRLLTATVSAYYSHPIVWSEIGYAGPAYPRGYVRSELGLTDPWEAKQTDAQP